MYMFQSEVFGRILHTGDCRLTMDVVHNTQQALFGSTLDLVYMDCTFGEQPMVSLFAAYIMS